jgi:putative monooxygenase
VTGTLERRTFHRIGQQIGEPDARLDGRQVHVLAAPSLGNARHLSLGVTVVHAGASSAAHRHAAEEAVIVLEGRLRLVVDEQVVDLAAGDAVVIPADADHRIQEVGGADATALWIYCPAGPQRRLLR